MSDLPPDARKLSAPSKASLAEAEVVGIARELVATYPRVDMSDASEVMELDKLARHLKQAIDRLDDAPPPRLIENLWHEYRDEERAAFESYWTPSNEGEVTWPEYKAIFQRFPSFPDWLRARARA